MGTLKKSPKWEWPYASPRFALRLAIPYNLVSILVHCTVPIRCKLSAKYQLLIIPLCRDLKDWKGHFEKTRLKFKERTTVSFRFRPHKRPEIMQTFTLDLIAISYETKFVAFALRQRACFVKEPTRPRPHTKRARQTLSLGGTSTYQCWPLHLLWKLRFH